MDNEPVLTNCGLYPVPAQPAAGRQGSWQVRTAGVAMATSRSERGQQRGMPVAGAAGRSSFLKCVG